MSEEEKKQTEEKQVPLKKFRYIGHHAQDLNSGAVMAPGDFVDLALDNDFDKRLEEDGLLIPVE